MTNEAAKRLDQAGIGKYFCLAGVGGQKEVAVKRSFLYSLVFVLGFSAELATLFTVMASVAPYLRPEWMNYVVAAICVLLGLHFLELFHLPISVSHCRGGHIRRRSAAADRVEGGAKSDDRGEKDCRRVDYPGGDLLPLLHHLRTVDVARHAFANGRILHRTDSTVVLAT
ncbi:MAG: hypothetical protein GXP25_02030 [Planctomycetes bacterium]|nr:hypothetical protein [Planctomycetota bacterium]